MIRYFKYLPLLVLLAPNVSKAEKAPSSPEVLKKTATHIVTATVKSIYSRTEIDGDWKFIRYVAEVKVEEIEKGEGIKKDDLIYVRYYSRVWNGAGDPPPSESGHYPTPDKNEKMRIYLAKNAYDGYSNANNDGGFNVLGANGWEELKKPKESK